jgi:hypothetical protein
MHVHHLRPNHRSMLVDAGKHSGKPRACFADTPEKQKSPRVIARLSAQNREATVRLTARGATCYAAAGARHRSVRQGGCFRLVPLRRRRWIVQQIHVYGALWPAQR